MHRPKYFLTPLLCLAILVATTSRSHADISCTTLLAHTPPTTTQTPDTKLPQHVFLLILENEGYKTTFEGPDAPYLKCLAKERGQLLTNYYGIGHYSLDNYIAMVSGQPPNLDTQNDCQAFTEFQLDSLLPDGEAKGHGCVYPRNISTLANQLTDRHLTWGGYMEDMRRPCEHPQIGDWDGTQRARTDNQYAARHNPFVYFHSIIDDPKQCANDKPFENLEVDLKSVATTPNLVFITPNLCNDGHDAHCAGHPTDEKDGLAAADRFLQKWVPKILESPAYKKDGMLIITFDEAELGSDQDDYSKCCNEQPGPNVTQPGLKGPGGGQIGAVIISPFVSPGSTNPTEYNHYSLLRSLEDLFGLSHLGYANQKDLPSFGRDVYNAHPTSASNH
jgi:phosphatidylinositol-3-phosphatase